MSEYFESPSPSLSKSSSTTSNSSSNNGTILNIDDDDNDITKCKVTSEYSKGDKLVGMIHSTMRKGDSGPLGKRKVIRKTYVHSQNRKDKNCEETFHSLRHFDECQNLNCRDCMHLIEMSLSHYK